jgi:hypothetical protein
MSAPVGKGRYPFERQLSTDEARWPKPIAGTRVPIFDVRPFVRPSPSPATIRHGRARLSAHPSAFVGGSDGASIDARTVCSSGVPARALSACMEASRLARSALPSSTDPRKNGSKRAKTRTERDGSLRLT